MKKKRRIRHHVNPLSDLTDVHFEGFSNKNPIIVDVGADRGEFVEELLTIKPEYNFVVFEIRKPLFESLRDKFSDYDNVRVFCGDASRNFKNVLYPSIKRGVFISEIFINFPDPWFKAKHKKRRFLNDKFLIEVKKWIHEDTKWIFQTDQKKLFEDTFELLKRNGISDIELFYDSPYNVRTRWENSKLESNCEIYRMKFFL